MLLKIGKVYINTDHVLKWNVNSTNGGGSISAIDKDGDTIEVFHAEKTPPDVMMALVRWLNENSTDIMATAAPQPAPVETVRKFKKGQVVRVTAAIEGTYKQYIEGSQRIGRVIGVKTDYPAYDITFGGHIATLHEDQLEPAD